MPGAVYAAVSDITARGHDLTAQQQQAAEVLLADASAMLREEAAGYDVSIDARIADADTGEDYARVVTAVICDAVCRALDAADSSGAVTQASETLGLYSYTMHYAASGEAIYFKKSELARLSIARQVIGFADLYGVMGNG